VTIGGYEFRTSIARMGGRYLLGVSNERRAESGIAAGDTLDVDGELDTAEAPGRDSRRSHRGVGCIPGGKGVFESLSYSKQQWHTLQVTSAKKPETRANLVATAVAMLAAGRAR
jgi:hypothetical protein